VQFAEINSNVMHYQMIGGPEGRPTLVFSNSLGTDFRIWREVIVRLAGEYPILTYDKRGHGLSDVGESPYSIEDHVWDLSHLLDHAGVERAIVCGISVGGMIAMGLHEARPEIVEALILCDTAHRIGEPEMWDARIDAVQSGGLDSIADPVMERWFSSVYRDEFAAEYAGLRNMFIRQPEDGYTGTCAAIRDADMEDIARQIDVPTLMIAGEQDLSTPVDKVAETQSLIEGARLETIAHAGHLPCVEKGEEVADLVRRFARDVTGPGAQNG